MGAWELLLAGAIILLGICGVLAPGVPGSWLVWAGVLWWALNDPRPTAWAVLVGATLLLLLAQLLRAQISHRRDSRTTAVGRRSDLRGYAGAGAFLGFFLLPVIGAVPGFLGGLYLHERVGERRRPREARAAVRSLMGSGGTVLLVELYAALLVLGAWLLTVLTS
ncbi:MULTISPECIES: DUF456 domain-containing protein [Streptomyces]|uniref:DUF456 domain-containing protein n=1 Tax=Streptomyces chilikensis TaxID=1194079 RepID=A0ABV3ES87_9ACTN|nr:MULTISPECIES: DUF456 domain-containing protein [Streptomyces]MDH6223942.1 uncharacterized protein YqgC (DUF456 family) [Streptomyces sp. MJP52]